MSDGQRMFKCLIGNAICVGECEDGRTRFIDKVYQAIHTLLPMYNARKVWVKRRTICVNLQTCARALSSGIAQNTIRRFVHPLR